MTRTTPRRLAAAVAITTVPLLSSCGVNFNAQTDQVYTPADGVNDRSGSVDVLNALIISNQAGVGRLVAGLANNAERPDALTEVRGAEQGTSATIQKGDTTIPAGGYLQLAHPGAAMVAVTGAPTVVAPGKFVRVTFVFKNAEPATVDVPVLPPVDGYSGIPLPSGSEVSSPTPKG